MIRLPADGFKASFGSVFGFSFGELLVIGVVALVAVGPQKLPGMLRTLGEWVRKARNITHEVRAQSGIDEILRSEGLHGGLNELRGLMRGPHVPAYVPPPPQPEVPAVSRYEDPYANLEIDPTKEYPPEGPDAHGALPDDLVYDPNFVEPTEATEVSPEPAVEQAAAEQPAEPVLGAPIDTGTTPPPAAPLEDAVEPVREAADQRTPTASS